MDKSVVTVASTVHTHSYVSKVKRYSQKQKRNREVNCPKMVQEYNQHMGGTDRLGQNVRKYQIATRGKKWYWCIFTWLVDVTVQNAWLLHKKCGGSLRQFEFKEYIAQSYLSRSGISPKSPGRPKSGSSTKDTRVLDDVRYDIDYRT